MSGRELRRILVWQWGRRGAGPRVAAEMAGGFGALPGRDAILSLSTHAELLDQPDAPAVALPVPTYRGLGGFVLRVLGAPLRRRRLRRRIAALRLDVAICAMPGPLDLEMAAALRALGVPFVVVVHDADRHPGDGFVLQMLLQRRLVARAAGIVTLSEHVTRRLREQGSGRPMLQASLPPFVFGPEPAPPLAHGGAMRLLCFGRLLPYKGLDLLADALADPIGDRFELRVVGQGPHSPVLDRLAAIPGVRVENRWVPEGEIGALIGWADAVLLPYREASQSGVAAAAIAARRWVVATRVGGLVEQFRDQALAILCEPEPEPLRAAVKRLLASPPPASASDGSGDSPEGDGPRRAWSGVAAELLDGIARVVEAGGGDAAA